MTSSADSKLEELKNPELVSNINRLQSQIDDVEKVLLALCESDGEDVCRNLDAAGKAQLDMFLTYAVNSLFFVYLRSKGQDATNHAVKNELGRVREHMARAKQLKDRALAPRLDTGAAKRFVRGGLWQPKTKDANNKDEKNQQSRKRKRDAN